VGIGESFSEGLLDDSGITHLLADSWLTEEGHGEAPCFGGYLERLDERGLVERVAEDEDALGARRASRNSAHIGPMIPSSPGCLCGSGSITSGTPKSFFQLVMWSTADGPLRPDPERTSQPTPLPCRCSSGKSRSITLRRPATRNCRSALFAKRGERVPSSKVRPSDSRSFLRISADHSAISGRLVWLTPNSQLAPRPSRVRGRSGHQARWLFNSLEQRCGTDSGMIAFVVSQVAVLAIAMAATFGKRGSAESHRRTCFDLSGGPDSDAIEGEPRRLACPSRQDRNPMACSSVSTGAAIISARMADPLWIFNPDPLPGAQNLWELARGLEQVRARVDQEGAGVISPWRQLQAVDAVLQQGQDVIGDVMRGLGPTGGAISARDAFLYANVLVQHSILILYWLRLGEDMRRLPDAPGKTTPLSPAASQSKREHALARIRHSRQETERCLRFLSDVDPKTLPSVTHLLRGMSVQMLCAEILADVLVRQCAAQEIPAATIDKMVEAVARVRLSPDFLSLPDNVQAFVWQTLAGLYGVQGDMDKLRAVLRSRRDLIDSDQSRERQILQLMPLADNDAEKFALLAELGAIARSSERLPVFSRERVGRLSVLKDVHWWAAASVAAESPYAVHILDEAFSLQRFWLFDIDFAAPAGNVRVAADWHGSGRLSWRDDEGDHVSSFKLESDVVATFLIAMAKLRPLDSRPSRRMRAMLTAQIGPLAPALNTLDEIRLEVGGSAAQLPLLLTEVDGLALGQSDKIAYAHPAPDVDHADAGTAAFDLLIVDDCFTTTDVVVAAAYEAAARSATELRVLRFDSANPACELSHEDLEQALASASNALLFCHVEAGMWYAKRSGDLYRADVALPRGRAGWAGSCEPDRGRSDRMWIGTAKPVRRRVDGRPRIRACWSLSTPLHAMADPLPTRI
jgi:hypothetical protein